MKAIGMNNETSENGSHRANGHGPSRLVLVSNRGPVEHSLDAEGRLTRHLNAGGVATALSSVTANRPVTWIANGASLADCALARSGREIDLDASRRLRLVAPPAETYELFYNVFSNPILWFVQHGLAGRLTRFEPADVVDAWERGYLPVNHAFAEAIVGEIDRAGGAARVMSHDYHLYAAPLFVRNLRPVAVLQHFVHIPWPEPAAWNFLPRSIVESICEGLLANDSVAFQTPRDARNFLHTCAAYLPGARVDAAGSAVLRGGRTTRVRANPVSVDIWDLRAKLTSPEAAGYRQRLGAKMSERTIVRVDRLDPTKNVAAGFRAYARLLEQHREWMGRVAFLAFLVPSRTGVPEYQEHAKEVFAEIESVNRRFGTADWTPIEVFHEHNRAQALVALSLYDVLLVNPVIDGMNLVSKEGAVLNDRDGVLVLSQTAGSFAELRDGALAIDPHDIDGTAGALHRALAMPDAERAERARLLRAAVLRHDLRRWLRVLLEDLEADTGTRAIATTGSGPAHARP